MNFIFFKIIFLFNYTSQNQANHIPACFFKTSQITLERKKKSKWKKKMGEDMDSEEPLAKPDLLVFFW
jgi:hypothetical protein